MLELRPDCEQCGKPLPPAATDARICSFECTFCADCVAAVLHDVCPNCGGNFVPRPIRPANDWKGGNHLGRYPAGTRARYRPVDQAAHAAYAAAIEGLAPEMR